MIRCRLQIGDGDVADTQEQFGLIFKKSSTYFEAPQKKRDATAYAEQAGENADPRTVADAFDYVVEFAVVAPNGRIENANTKIAAFNMALYTGGKGDVRKMHTVTFYDDYKHCKIVGTPSLISEAKSLYRRADGSVRDCVVVEFKIRVTNPSLCDFSYTGPTPMPYRLALSTDGHTLFAGASGGVTIDNTNYCLMFLTRGHNRVRTKLTKANGKRTHETGHLRWHADHVRLCRLVDGEVYRRRGDDQELNYDPLVETIVVEDRYSPDDIRLIGMRKSNNSRPLHKFAKGMEFAHTYGLAIYTTPSRGQRGKRVSNVCYFRKHVRVLSDGSDGDDGEWEEWITI